MTKQEQIEEMAKIIDDRLIEANLWLGSMNKGKGYWIAEKLVEHYQPKLPIDSVVLLKEEYNSLINIKKFFETADSEISAGNLLVYLKEFKKEERKETAEKIYTKIKNSFLMNSKNRYKLKIWIKEQFGVDIYEQKSTTT